MPGAAALAIAAFALAGAALAGAERRLWAATGVVYAGALAFSVCLLRESPDVGALAIAFLFAVVWGTDIFAYFGGRLIGGPKLWPRVSAGKTWSGTITGVLCGAVLGLVAVYLGAGPQLATGVCSWSDWPPPPSRRSAIFSNSSVKRRFGVKDFEPAHSRPWRRHGSARRLHLRQRLRGGGGPAARRAVGGGRSFLLVGRSQWH